MIAESIDRMKTHRKAPALASQALVSLIKIQKKEKIA